LFSREKSSDGAFGSECLRIEGKTFAHLNAKPMGQIFGGTADGA